MSLYDKLLHEGEELMIDSASERSLYFKNLTNWLIFDKLEPELVSQIRMAVIYGIKALFMTKDGTVYLSTFEFTLSDYPKKTTFINALICKIDFLCEEGVRTFAYGSKNYALVLTDIGQVYSYGCNLDDCKPNEEFFRLVYLHEKKIVDIACSKYYSLALTKDGNVYQWRQDSNGVINGGYWTNKAWSMESMEVLKGKRIISISCGKVSSAVVTDTGELYMWGGNKYGQLGLGHREPCMTPTKVMALANHRIVKVACGKYHTLALTDDGCAYIWGKTVFTNHRKKSCNSTYSDDSDDSNPKKIDVYEEDKKITDIAALWYSSICIFVLEIGIVYVGGDYLGWLDDKVPFDTSMANLHEALMYYAYSHVIHISMSLCGEGIRTILSSVEQTFDDPSISDLTIEVQGKPIYVHKDILRFRCQYFDKMLRDPWVENKQSFIQHKQFSYNVYKAFLKYLYNNNMDVCLKEIQTTSDLQELIKLADMYGEDELMEYYDKILKRRPCRT